MIRSGLLICSFYLKKRFCRNDETVLELNKEYGYNGKNYANVLCIMKSFCENKVEYADDESSMKMFSVLRGSISDWEDNDYKALSFTVHSGQYGLESDLMDRRTQKVQFHRNEDVADIKSFKCLVLVPNDTDNVKVNKGIFVFQTIATYGVKTITIKHMKEFFAEMGLTLETRSVSVRTFVEKLMERGNLHCIKFIKNRISSDNSDNIFVSIGREERSYYKPKLTESFKGKILDFLDGKSNSEVIEIEDNSCENIKITFKIGSNYRTVELYDINRLSVVEDIPDSIFNNGKYDEKVLIEYMIGIAKTYKNKMVLTVNEDL